MKNKLLIPFVLFLLSVTGAFYYVDKAAFLSPIFYQRDFLIRNDNRGEGHFAADRSGSRLHNGIDLLAPLGTPVLASRLGIVAQARQTNGMGKFVILKHFGGVTTTYGHLSQIYVREGEIVRQGDCIGAVGKTGNANYRDILPHLHFEVRKYGTPQDPLEYLE
ncbi:MAG: M23 family metallopeptidase [Candidatus Omnitrophica bacterium]|nr:M23 family metallopeptidase [Candidatus Omnitrophota bacterium]